jgi:hypothetical protein
VKKFFVGIDDTDNLESRGTGHRARQLGALLDDVGIGVTGITRHQLLVDPRIPYTSHNSSACLAVRCEAAREEELIERSREFLLQDSAPGSDAGLCVARQEQADVDVIAFGCRAKREVLEAPDAHALAGKTAIHLEGLTGTRIGVIGALAGVGLCASGDDGRYLWMRGLRELQGIVRADAILALGVDEIATEDGRRAEAADRIDVGQWPRPIPRAGRVVLLVEDAAGSEWQWQLIPKDRIKQLSA